MPRIRRSRSGGFRGHDQADRAVTIRRIARSRSRGFRTLGQDPYFQRLVKEHNPAFGYTTAEGLIEEDCATAVHIYNTEKFGLLGHPVVDYFRKSDDGIHVLAFLLYRRLLAQSERAPRRYEALVQEAASEILARGGLEAAFNAVPDHFVVATLRQQ